MMKKINFTFPPLLPWQREVVNDNHRFKVLNIGRRAGKTFLCSYICMKLALTKNRQKILWLSPSLSQGREAIHHFEDFMEQVNKAYNSDTKRDEYIRIYANTKIIKLKNKSFISMATGNNCASEYLRGGEYNLVILDEVAVMNPDLWHKIIRPSLTNLRGNAIFASTPQGKNWFFDIYNKGQDPKEKDWKSWTFPSTANPQNTIDEMEDCKRDIGPISFAQEMEAKFVTSGISVFSNLHNCVNAFWQDKPLTNHEYYVGVDLGRNKDYTVISVFDKTLNHICHFERFQEPYDYSKEMIRRIINLFKPVKVVIEQNSAGMVIVEDLKNELGDIIEGFLTTNATKEKIIDQLSLALSKADIQLPNNKVMLEEFNNYTVTKTALGKKIYQAAFSFHDDCIMSIAICYNAAIEENIFDLSSLVFVNT